MSNEIEDLERLVASAQETHAIAGTALAEARLAWYAVLIAEGDDRGRRSVADARAVHERAAAALATAVARLADAKALAEAERLGRQREAVAAQIREALAHGPATAREILSRTPGRRAVVGAMLEGMHVRGEVVRVKTNTGAQYRLSDFAVAH